jgi:hypothetical protein
MWNRYAWPRACSCSAGDFASSNFISSDGANTVEMIRGSEVRKTDFPIEPLLLDRWSPRAMSGEEISEES